jgi:hypothetical protein
MTPQQIQAYFGTDIVYIFNGTAEELSDLMIANSISFNYITDGATQVVYFVSTDGSTVPEDSRISRM